MAKPGNKKSGVLVWIVALAIVAVAVAVLNPDELPVTTRRNQPAEAMGTPPAATDDVTLVDFWATWCGPCHVQAPIIESVANRYRGRVSVMKVDVDRDEELASRFGITGIPTLILFKGGVELRRFVGVQSEAALAAALDQALL